MLIWMSVGVSGVCSCWAPMELANMLPIKSEPFEIDCSFLGGACVKQSSYNFSGTLLIKYVPPIFVPSGQIKPYFRPYSPKLS